MLSKSKQWNITYKQNNIESRIKIIQADKPSQKTAKLEILEHLVPLRLLVDEPYDKSENLDEALRRNDITLLTIEEIKEESQQQ